MTLEKISFSLSPLRPDLNITRDSRFIWFENILKRGIRRVRIRCLCGDHGDGDGVSHFQVKIIVIAIKAFIRYQIK